MSENINIDKTDISIKENEQDSKNKTKEFINELSKKLNNIDLSEDDSEQDYTDDDSEEDSEDDSEDDSDYDDESIDDKSTVSSTKYARDALFGNVVWRNKLFENRFSNILKFLEFTTENRGVNKAHVDTIFNHYLENPDEFIKPLDIMCYYEEGMETDHFYIADGQHRFMALKKLFEEKGIDKELLYFIHDVKNQEDIRRTIKYLNSSNPVTSIYSFEKIPDFIKKIEAKYTNLFSDNTKHSEAKMNAIKLRDHIEEIKLFKDSEFGVDDAFNNLIEFNKKSKEDFLKRTNKPAADKKLFDKIAETHQFYGLIYKNYTWVNEFYLFVQEKNKTII
jgi:hypothetical protein